MSDLVAIVLAAGHGTRMKSSLPKVLHRACGRPLVYYPVQAALELGADKVVIVVNSQTRAKIVEELSLHVPSDKFSVAVQEVPLGTGDAARRGVETIELSKDDRVLILSGDVPLLEADDLREVVTGLDSKRCCLKLMTFFAQDPRGYGRILRDSGGAPREIREEKDLRSSDERQITEVNAGVYAALAGDLRQALGALDSDNAQGEFYLTDIVPLLAKTGTVTTVKASEQSLAGVNDRAQLNEIEEILFARIRRRWGKLGVTIKGRPLIDESVHIEPEALIEDGVRLRGKTRIGAHTHVDVGTVIQDTEVGERATIKPYCVLSESTVGANVQLGPFAHLRPQTVLQDDVHIGNFVETKKSLIKKGAKANHLAYLGDAEIGEKSNIGAGTIVCNYDGFLKSRTVVGAGVFIGSDSQLVAPLNIGAGAYVATGTTVTQDIPANALAIGRVRQINKEGYASRLRARLQSAAQNKKSKT